MMPCYVLAIALNSLSVRIASPHFPLESTPCALTHTPLRRECATLLLLPSLAMSHSPSSQAEKPSSHGSTMKPSQTQVSEISATEETTPLPVPAHTITAEEIVTLLDSDVMRGLTPAKVQSHVERWGTNQLKPPVRPSLWKIFLRQIANAMTIVLMCVFL